MVEMRLHQGRAFEVRADEEPVFQAQQRQISAPQVCAGQINWLGRNRPILFVVMDWVS
jgi:hypothetical protein